MSWRRMTSMRWLAAAALLLAAGPAFGAGFGIFEQGAKAMGMAGAFTAQADDPSLLWHNAGGLAFVNDSEFSLGATWIHSTKAEFRGAAPYPGPGISEEEKPLSAFPPHAYYVSSINRTWKWGLGIESPFGLVTEWKNPNTFSGRFISTKAELQVLDLNPTLGWQVTPNFGIGVGGVARLSKVELDRHLPFVNPFGNPLVLDVGSLKLQNDTWDRGYGWNVGILHKVTPSFSWGASYRSKVTVDYTGDARIAQISTGSPQLDALLAMRIPYNTSLPIKTSIDFPDLISLGVAFSVSPNFLVEVDANRTGWSKFKSVVIRGTNATSTALFGANGTDIPQDWENANNFRIGARWNTSMTTQARVGFVRDMTPQPEASVNPLLPDADRNGFTVGYGSNGHGFNWDVALMYLKFKERSRAQTRSVNGVPVEPVFNGTYNTTAWLLGLTIGWR